MWWCCLDWSYPSPRNIYSVVLGGWGVGLKLKVVTVKDLSIKTWCRLYARWIVQLTAHCDPLVGVWVITAGAGSVTSLGNLVRLGGGCCHPPPPSEGPSREERHGTGDGELDADTGSPLYSSGFCHDCPVIAILSSCLLLRCPTAWLITAAGCGLAATRRIINPMTLTNTVPRPASCHPQAHRTGHQGGGRPQMTLLIILWLYWF